MSPLPYQADTTGKIALVNPSTTTVPVLSKWKKACVAMTIGAVVLVAGNSWKEGSTLDSAAAVSVSHLTLGDAMCKFEHEETKDQCICIFDKCGDLILKWESTTPFQQCMECMSHGIIGCTEYMCFFERAMGDGTLRQCFGDHHCISP